MSIKRTKIIIAGILAIISIFLVFRTVKLRSEGNNNIALSNTFVLQEDKSKGLLAINIDKTVYTTGDQVYIQVASLKPDGQTDCSDNLILELSKPNADKENIIIEKSPSCGIDQQNTNSPDFKAFFEPKDTGLYNLTLTNNDTKERVSQTFEVTNNTPEYKISRWSPTKNTNISDGRNVMIIKLEFLQDFKGIVRDVIPSNLKLVWYGPAQLATQQETTSIEWQLDIKANTTTELKYEYTTTENTECFEIIGPVTVGTEKIENSFWKVAFAKNCTQ